MKEFWDLIDHYTSLGCKVSFRRFNGQIQIELYLVGKDARVKTNSQILPDDHMPESLKELLPWMYNQIKNK